MSSLTAYTVSASYFHWLAAVPMIASIGSVLKAQSAPKKEKGAWMFRHKSFGLLSGMIVAPRFGLRLYNSAKYKLRSMPDSGHIESGAASLSHMALYGFMTVMPATGIAMGYYGGKGLPFFYTTLPGAATKNGAIAKQSFSIHKTVGTYGKYLVPVHAAASLQHAARGHKIFSRINPFRTPRA